MLNGHRGTRVRVAAGLALALLGIALLGGCGSSSKPATTATGPATTTTATTPTTTTAPSPSGKRIDGIPCESTEQLIYHVHAHLTLLRDGQPLVVPQLVGISIPAQCFYYLHTHDTTGVIHIEAPRKRQFTLGEFFDIWGEPLSRIRADGLSGKLRFYVDGRPYTGNPRDIGLVAHRLITVEQGKQTPPPDYTFGPGL